MQNPSLSHVEKIDIGIKSSKINITLSNIEDDPTVNKIFRIQRLNGNQQMIQAKNKEVETLEDVLTTSTENSNKRDL